MKVFIEHEGQKYYNYDLRFTTAPSWLTGVTTMVDQNVRERLETMEGLCDTTFSAPKGSDVYVMPHCKVALDDIRKNYKTKKKVDTGICNVLSPVLLQRCRVVSVSISLYPSRKLAIATATALITAQQTSNIAANHDHLYTMLYNTCPLDTVQIESSYLVEVVKEKQYILPVLEGTLSKPCISVDSLCYDTGNKITLDALQIYYRTGIRPWYESGVKENFEIQCKALNQSNWRDYPGTICLINHMMVMSGGSVFNRIVGRRASQSKPVKSILSCESHFVTDDDRRMAQDFLDSLLNIGEGKFTTPSILLRKCNNLGITIDEFEDVFSCVCRVVPR